MGLTHSAFIGKSKQLFRNFDTVGRLGVPGHRPIGKLESIPIRMVSELVKPIDDNALDHRNERFGRSVYLRHLWVVYVADGTYGSHGVLILEGANA